MSSNARTRAGTGTLAGRRAGWLQRGAAAALLCVLGALTLDTPQPAAGQQATLTPVPAADPGGALRFEDTDPSVVYGGVWTTSADPRASAGALHRSATAGATAQLAFSGPAVTWVTSRGPTRGIARVIIDGELRDTVDLYRPNEEFRADLDYRSGGGGAHTIRIEVTGTRNGSATDAVVDVDAFVVNNAPATPVATATPLPTATQTATPGATASATPTSTATTVPAGPTAVAPAPTAPAAPTTAPAVPTAPPGVRDQRFFVQTSFRIDDDAFWDYFNARGGIATFGFPISRAFTFLGCTSQFFQRQLMQQCPGTGVRTMNLLDPELMPYSQINFSSFPAHDPAVAGAAPAPGTPSYGAAVLAHIRAVSPDDYQGQPVRFFTTFVSTVPGTDPQRDPDFAALVNLEVWGFPTSNPAPDPTNGQFIYQRFQRGIMHFRAATGTTEGILLADYFKTIITGRNLPADLAAQAAASPYLNQYCPGSPNWVCRPLQLRDTDLTFAFEPQ